MIPVERGYLRLSLSNTFGRLVGAPGAAEEPVVVVRDRPRMKYQTMPAMIASPMMIHSQGVPPSVDAGAAGEPGAAGGVAWARASVTAPSDMIMRRVEPVEHHGPLWRQELRVNVGHHPVFLLPQEVARLALDLSSVLRRSY